MERYNIKNIENKWQDIWSKKKTNTAVLDKNKKKFLSMQRKREMQWLWSTPLVVIRIKKNTGPTEIGSM